MADLTQKARDQQERATRLVEYMTVDDPVTPLEILDGLALAGLALVPMEKISSTVNIASLAFMLPLEEG